MEFDLARERLEGGWEVRAALAREVCPRGARVLDVGSAWGEYTLPLAEVASEVTALDPDARALGWLETFAAARGLRNIGVTTASLHEHEGGYDLVWCTNTLQILSREERVPFLTALGRLLVPDGRAFVDFYTPRYLAFRVAFQRGLGLRLRAISGVRLLLRRHTLTVGRFRDEVAKAGLGAVAEFDSDAWRKSREHEGHDFSTPLGRYFHAFTLGRG